MAALREKVTGTYTREAIQQRIQHWQELLQLWDEIEVNTDTDDINTAVFKLYLQTQRVDKTFATMKGLGYDIKGGSNEVTRIIREETIENRMLEHHAKLIHKQNCTTASRIH